MRPDCENAQYIVYFLVLSTLVDEQRAYEVMREIDFLQKSETRERRDISDHVVG